MDNFSRKLITEWRRLDLPSEGETVVVGVSGGADSISLLLALSELKEAGKLKNRIVAAHFNHKLRGDASDEDEAFVASITSSHKIEFARGRSKSKPESDIEQAARVERFAFLHSTAKAVGASLIVTAHTLNDQAETFLMNLIRGSGRQGLGAIRAVRPMSSDDGVRLVRPLLSWATRAETEAFCHNRGVEYRYDSMNEDTAFRRVRIRKILLPLLADFNPNIVEVLANTAFLLQNDGVNEPTENQEDIPDELTLASLVKLSEPELAETIRAWLAARRGNLRGLGLKHTQAIIRLVKSAKSGRLVEVPGGTVVKTGGRLAYRENVVEKKRSDL